MLNFLLIQAKTCWSYSLIKVNRKLHGDRLHSFCDYRHILLCYSRSLPTPQSQPHTDHDGGAHESTSWSAISPRTVPLLPTKPCANQYLSFDGASPFQPAVAYALDNEREWIVHQQ
ncbi:hypothetical protein BXA20_11850 [Corynebacterium diphtheriae]|nr:hypothetical protein BXA20_11850 [Corynebacterium diphtheriae]